MGKKPLYVSILWHMHQPYYKDLITDEYILPWVRLHAIKDYYDMVAVLDKFPNLKVTFNLVPSLLVQIEDYAENNASDKFLDLTLKEPKNLTADEKFFILKSFFMINWENMVKVYPRYYHLLQKRGMFVSEQELSEKIKLFSDQEILDLQVWYNLAWFGFIYKTQDRTIKALIKKGEKFTAKDKKNAIAKQKEIIRKVIAKYREACKRGQIEITTTPFYHPILPLVCSEVTAEDAGAQVRKAVEYHKKKFGKKVHGMWPSEGSVSEEIIPILAKNGIKWIATDEGILERSLRITNPDFSDFSDVTRFQPYIISREGEQLIIVFRNRFLSDQIGFAYHRLSPQEAAADFLFHLENIRKSLPDDQNYLVPIVLDGENAWEYFKNQGKDFFEVFYKKLSEEKNIITTTISEFIAKNPPHKKLTDLFAGSWINSNFKIWFGHAQDKLAWDYLNKTRLALVESKTYLPLAWEEIYIAEGSDWFWWYGDDFTSECDREFDALFRTHLKNVYHLIKEQAPAYLDVPIKPC